MIEIEKYIKCKYCGQICIYNSLHQENCITNWNENSGLKSCYSCGIDYNEKIFSQTQLKKDFLARCIKCVSTNPNKIIKHEKYIHLYKKSINEKIVSIQNINKQLEYYIKELNEEKIYELLKSGADPNYSRQKTIYDNKNHEYVYLYDSNGNEIKENDDDNNVIQPINPLRLCIFYLCDCTNTDEKFRLIFNIAKLLIDYRADKIDALYYYDRLYGTRILHNQYNLLNLLSNI